MVTVRHGDEFVPAADVAALPASALALRLLVALEQRRTDHPPQARFTLEWIERNAVVRWEEDGVANAAASGSASRTPWGGSSPRL